MNIIIIDDSESVVFLARKILEGQGHKTFYANSVKMALKLEANNHYDLILLDLEMPEEDGFEFLAQRVGCSHLSHVPVILMSGHNDEETIKKAKSLGVLDHLPKPFKPSEMLKILKDFGNQAE
jgi:phosphoserine phosphatase RsbU/P